MDDLEAWNGTPPERSMLVVFGAFPNLPFSVESYVRKGGALLVATDRGVRAGGRIPGVTFLRGPQYAIGEQDKLDGFADCPLVTDIDARHPAMDGVRVIATNRPGGLSVRGRFAGAEWVVVAESPRLYTEYLPAGVQMDAFAAAETPSGGKAMAVADQTIFSNQMLLYKDNARLTANLVSWLSQGERTSVLILDDQSVITPPAPEEVEVEIPPPTPEQVKEALKSLPRDVLIDFANTVAAEVEDAGIHNEIVAFLTERIPPRAYRRLLWLLSTLVLGVIVCRRVFSDTTPENAAGEANATTLRTAPHQRASLERQQAARVLMERFRAEVAGTSDLPWKVFGARIRIANQPWQTRRLRRVLRRASQRLDPGHGQRWTRRRLRKLETHLADWRRLKESGLLEYRTP
jgi:hypothetical protein